MLERDVAEHGVTSHRFEVAVGTAPRSLTGVRHDVLRHELATPLARLRLATPAALGRVGGFVVSEESGGVRQTHDVRVTHRNLHHFHRSHLHQSTRVILKSQLKH